MITSINEETHESVPEIVSGEQTSVNREKKKNITPRNPDGKDADLAMQEKFDGVDKTKRLLSPKLISPYGEASFFLVRNRY